MTFIFLGGELLSKPFKVVGDLKRLGHPVVWIEKNAHVHRVMNDTKKNRRVSERLHLGSSSILTNNIDKDRSISLISEKARSDESFCLYSVHRLPFLFIGCGFWR